MKLGILLVVMLGVALIPIMALDADAKCTDMDNCPRPLGDAPLKEQLKEEIMIYDMKCMKIEHWLKERPNGKLACVKHGTAEKLGWNDRHHTLADSNEETMVTSGTARIIPYTIVGATIKDMSYENNIVTTKIKPEAQYAVLSLMVKDELVTIDPPQCSTINNFTPSKSYIVAVNGEETKIGPSVNYSGEWILNIHVTHNVHTIDVIGRCDKLDAW